MSLVAMKCNELCNLYNEYTKSQEHSFHEKKDYINKAFNITNILNKFISLSIEGNTVEGLPIIQNEQQYQNPDEKTPIMDEEYIASSDDKEKSEMLQQALGNIIETMEKEKEAMKNKKKETSDNVLTEEELEKYSKYTPYELIKEELDMLGVNKNSAGYKNLLTIPEVYKQYIVDKDTTYNDIIWGISEICGVSKKQVYNNIQRIIPKMKFENSKLIPKFRVIDKNLITVEELIIELFEFCDESTE